MPTRPVLVLSSMATRELLADLIAAHERATGTAVRLTSIGGVDAARRVQAGEVFDVVMLAADAIDRLIAAGHLLAPRIDLARSPVAMAVRAGAPRPPIDTEAALRDAVLAARSVSCSTGPSGAHLMRLFERWGITDTIQARLVQPPPGVPVGSLVASGEVELGFQQLSELMNLEGIAVLGTLPPGAAFVTTFSAAIGRDSTQADAARRLLADLSSPAAAAVKQRHGMQPPNGDAS